MDRRLYLLLSVMEEADEVSQRISKLLKFTPDEVQTGQGKTNMRRLQEELVDLSAVVEMCVDAGYIADIDPLEGAAMMLAKKEKVEKYLNYSMDMNSPKSAQCAIAAPKEPTREPKFGKGDQVIAMIDGKEYPVQVDHLNKQISTMSRNLVYDVIYVDRSNGAYTPRRISIIEQDLRKNLAADLDIVVFPKTHLEYAEHRLEEQRRYVEKQMANGSRQEVIDSAFDQLHHWESVVADAKISN